jgi:hypothetical protein
MLITHTLHGTACVAYMGCTNQRVMSLTTNSHGAFLLHFGLFVVQNSKFSSSVAFWARMAEICSACVANAGVHNVVLPRSEEQI